MDSVFAFDLNSIKTEPAESSLSLTTQLNHSFNIQSLHRQNQIQKGWITENNSIQSIPQANQDFGFGSIFGFDPYLGESVSGNLEVDDEKSRQKSEYFQNRRQQLLASATPEQREQMRLKHSEVIRQQRENETEEQRKRRLERGREYARNYRKRMLEKQIEDSQTMASDSNCIGKKPLSRVPSLTLEENEALKKEKRRLRYLRQKANPKPVVDPEVEAEKQRQKSEYDRKYRQQLLANATPEQLEQRRVKHSEKVRRHRENQTEEQRERRLEHKRQYDRSMRKLRMELKRLNLIKTEPVESSLSLTTQLNHSLNIQSLLRQNQIQNGWITENNSIQSIPQTNMSKIPLSLDQSSSSIPNSAETTTTNCDIITTEMFSAVGPRAGFGRRAKLNVCYTVPKETKPEPVHRRQRNSVDITADTGNSESTNDNDKNFGFGSISGVDLSSASSTSAAVAAPVPVPSFIGKKPLSPVPSLTLEEKEASKRERDRLWYHRQKAKPVDPEVEAEKILQKREYFRNRRQRLFSSATPEQREQMRLKHSEVVRQQRENETEEQRKRRLERTRQYARNYRKRMLDKQNNSLEESQIGNSQTSQASDSNRTTILKKNKTVASDSNRIGKKPRSWVLS